MFLTAEKDNVAHNVTSAEPCTLICSVHIMSRHSDASETVLRARSDENSMIFFFVNVLKWAGYYTASFY